MTRPGLSSSANKIHDRKSDTGEHENFNLPRIEGLAERIPQLMLQAVPLTGRAFSIQFQQIYSEFGHAIPWLQPLSKIAYATDGRFFSEQLVAGLGLQDDNQIIPYQLVDDSPARTYVGGILHLKKAPEKFKDARNQEIAEELQAQDYHYLTCLQVRPTAWETPTGHLLTERAIAAIMRSGFDVWGVMAKWSHVQHYLRLGGVLLNDSNNDDGLFIVSIPRSNFRPRSTHNNCVDFTH